MDKLFAGFVKINAPVVVSETVGGETIIMHHQTGHYFDTSGTGAMIWEAIVTGATVDQIAALLSARGGARPVIARDAAIAFVRTLLTHDLVVLSPIAESGAEVAPFVDFEDDQPTFAHPVLGVHTDLADLLLLDPIHEVGEAGWPTPPQLATT